MRSSALARIFCAAFAIRLAFLIIFYWLAPDAVTLSQFQIPIPFFPIWNDEVTYLSAYFNQKGIEYSPFSLLDGKPNGLILDKVGRIALLFSYIFQTFGEYAASIRVASALLGSLTVVIIAKILRHFGERAEGSLFWLLVLAGPAFLQSSILVYKEALVQLGAALILLTISTALKQRRLDLKLAVLIISAFAIFLWSRLDFWPIVLGVSGVLSFLCFRIGNVRELRSLAVVLLVTVLPVLIFFPSVGGEDIVDARANAANLKGVSLGWASGLSGPLGIIHVPVSIVNPPTFWLHNYFIPNLSDRSWFSAAVTELRTLQWWFALSGLFLGINLAFKRAPGIAAFAFPFLFVFIAAPIIYNGVGPEVVRYRDTFLPAAAVLSILGYRHSSNRAFRRTAGVVASTGLVIWFFMNFR